MSEEPTPRTEAESAKSDLTWMSLSLDERIAFVVIADLIGGSGSRSMGDLYAAMEDPAYRERALVKIREIDASVEDKILK